MAMRRQRVRSSSIRTVGYDDETNTLELRYAGGKVYHYLDVPKEVFVDLLAAPSIGAFVNTDIKPNFDYVQVV
jgi:hypothetical protein